MTAFGDVVLVMLVVIFNGICLKYGSKFKVSGCVWHNTVRR